MNPKIPIKNVYYMLAYAFKALREIHYKKLATEEFENTADLFAEMVILGLSSQIRRGLARDYLQKTESLASPRGKLEISASIGTRELQQKRLVCTFDEYSVNSYMNRVIKSTITRCFLNEKLGGKVKPERKRKLRKLLLFLRDVDELDLGSVNWKFRFNQNNQTYRMLLGICELTVNGLLQTKADGTSKLMDFLDAQKEDKLYETFLLEYYREEHKGIRASAEQIDWRLDSGSSREMLPVMRSDVTLSRNNKVLIIDAKYYSSTTQKRPNSDKRTVHSANLYQIFTYVKNKDMSFGSEPHEVSGMLLYARTVDEVQPDVCYQMSGSKVSVRTLDLGADFSEITRQLDEIVAEHFGSVKKR